MTLSGTGKRLGALLLPPERIAAFPEVFARPHRHSATLLEAFDQPFPRTVAYREAILQPLQRLAESLEATSNSFSAPHMPSSLPSTESG